MSEETDAPTAVGRTGRKVTIATAWLDGCSGCHMSFLDMDQRLVDLAGKVEIVYSPLVDSKELPEGVDLGILEGSISNDEDLHKARQFRERCKLLISLGDCAVNGNVPAMRNPFRLDAVYDRAYRENVTLTPQVPSVGVPALLQKVKPVHGVVPVDVFVPGCPPNADAIYHVLSELIAGRMPDPSQVTRFGA
jgi:NAD-reducing hydrogenase small subunit